MIVNLGDMPHHLQGQRGQLNAMLAKPELSRVVRESRVVLHALPGHTQCRHWQILEGWETDLELCPVQLALWASLRRDLARPFAEIVSLELTKIGLPDRPATPVLQAMSQLCMHPHRAVLVRLCSLRPTTTQSARSAPTANIGTKSLQFARAVPPDMILEAPPKTRARHARWVGLGVAMPQFAKHVRLEVSRVKLANRLAKFVHLGQPSRRREVPLVSCAPWARMLPEMPRNARSASLAVLDPLRILCVPIAHYARLVEQQM